MIGFSKTGNTFTFIDYIISNISNDIDVIKTNYKDVPSVDLSNYDLIIVGSSTWGDGKIPKNCKEFIVSHATKYNKKWIVFGTGNSLFVHYCKAVDSIKKILEDTGNTVLETFKYEQRFNLDKLEDHDIIKLRKIKKIIQGELL